MRNLEIKVQVESLDEIRSRLGFAMSKGTLEQEDTYYLLGEKRLKVREEQAKSEVIFYTRALKDGTRESSYHMFNLPHFCIPLLKFILRIRYGTKIVVKKTRNLYLFKHTRIHLDIVQQLGTFVELETVIKDEGNDTEYIGEHDEVKRLLSLDQYPTIAGSYSDLLGTWITPNNSKKRGVGE